MIVPSYIPHSISFHRDLAETHPGATEPNTGKEGHKVLVSMELRNDNVQTNMTNRSKRFNHVVFFYINLIIHALIMPLYQFSSILFTLSVGTRG